MVTVQRHLFIPMRDGIRLAASVHWPESAAGDSAMAARPQPSASRYPAIIEYHPYRKDDRSAARAADHDYFARNGFVSIRLDVRGTGSSEGVNTDEYMLVETRDGYDAVEWIASRPWCNGNVGMFGSSYGGFTCFQVATLRPPHLKAIAPIYATDDRYTDDCHYKGGAFKAYYDVGTYGTMMIALNALPPDFDAFADWERRWQERLESNQPYMQMWLAHQTDGPYWRPGSLRGQYTKIQAATFMIGGWQDGYPNPLFRTFEKLSCPKKLLVGPWNHSRPSVAIPRPRIDYLKEIRRWFDLWLKGDSSSKARAVGASKDPAIAFFVQSYDDPDPGRQTTTGEWRAERRWPIAGARERTLRMSPPRSVGPGTTPGGLLLRQERPGGSRRNDGNSNRLEASASLVYDPTVGTCGGLWSGGLPFGLPGDQRPDEARSIVFTTLPLRRPLTIAGYPRATLRVSSSAAVAAFVVKLADVAPDGRSALVARGILNGTRRNGMRSPEGMMAGRVYEIDVPVDASSWRFEVGHRVRVAISGADFPNSWPTPMPAKLTVYFGGARPSAIHLPVIPESKLAPPEFDPPPPIKSLLGGKAATAARQGARGSTPVSVALLTTPEPDVWEYREEVIKQAVTLRVRRGGTTQLKGGASGRSSTHSSDELELTVSRRDPADVSAEGTSTSRIERGDHVIEAVARQQIRSDADSFHWSVDLRVVHNGRAKFSRKWQKSFPRVLL